MKKETTEENSVDVGAQSARYSLSENAKQEVEQALNDKYYGKEVKLTDVSPSILIGHKGVRNLPMMMKASHIRENVFTEAEAKAKGLKIDKSIHYHGLGKELFLKVIDDLDNVTEAYRGTKNAENPERREEYFLLISKQKDKNGNVINIPVYINKKGTYNRVIIDTNKIATVFGRDEIYLYIREQISKGNLVRIKKETLKPVNLRHQLPHIMEKMFLLLLYVKIRKSQQKMKKKLKNLQENLWTWTAKDAS